MKKAAFQLEKAMDENPESGRANDIQALLREIRQDGREKAKEEESEDLRRRRSGALPLPG